MGARYFAHVQTGPEAYPTSCTMGTGSFPEVKRPGRGVDHPRSQVRVELYLYGVNNHNGLPNENYELKKHIRLLNVLSFGSII
jgi:hypothetical protein